MEIVFTSEGKIFHYDGKTKTEIPCERLNKYKKALSDIRRRKEWKTTGAGAMFTGQTEVFEDENNVYSEVTALTPYEDGLIYGILLDSSSGIYSRSLDPSDDMEGLIISSADFRIKDADFRDGMLAVSLGSGDEYHIALFEPPSAAYDEYTDGDTCESYISFSNSRKGRIYFSTSGNARSNYGGVQAHSPMTGAYLDIHSRTMGEVLSDEKYDFIRLQDDDNGDLWYIRQPYGGEHEKDGMKISDIFLAPFRILKALGGWLNFMSVLWGGQSLNGKDPSQMLNERTKNRSARDIIIDGNVIKASKAASGKQAEAPFIPQSRVLVHKSDEGETIVAKGVLDFTVDGTSVIYSDGHGVYRLEDGERKLITKAFLARNIRVLKNS